MLIVVSAINIYKGGSLTIAREFLRELCFSTSQSADSHEIVFFCHREADYTNDRHKRVTLIEKPSSRKHWLVRLYYEYIWFWFWSRRRTVDMWISLHDITPNVRAVRRYVYCHNPAPFYTGASVWRLEPSFELFRHFYRYLYAINIQKNDAVIVQQDWLRRAFAREFNIPAAQIIVALPEREILMMPKSSTSAAAEKFTRVIYPAIPRPFKNFEVLLRGMELLERENIQLVLTIDGSENRYATMLYSRFKHLKNVVFAGYMDHKEVFSQYNQAHAMVFPSQLETWGLPMSEFKVTSKPIFAANLPYARETLQGYDQAFFFAPQDFVELAALLKRLIRKEIQRCERSSTMSYDQPFAKNWHELLVKMKLIQDSAIAKI
jgi:glycosyltransferase involved in cell wall biosynthesis